MNSKPKSKPKNRTIIGIVCMVLAVAITFLIAPAVNKLTTDTVEVVRLSTDVLQGSKISEGQVEIVKMKTDTVPSGAFTQTAEVVGKYAASNLYAGDCLTKAKVTGNSNTADDTFMSLNGQKYAMSFTIDSFAAGLSGKLKNGDIISLVIMDKSTGKSIMPAEFKYVKIITTTTAGGVDQDKVVKNDDGSYEPPSTVTLLVNATQARLLAEYEESTINCVLVYRGTVENANKFLEKQDAYFATKGEGGQTTDTSTATETSSGKDIIQQANDIINNKADYYDVNEAVKNNG
mgnify:CR=1 FL=1